MIRYVLAVALATALLGVGLVALENGAAIRGETEVEGAVATVDRAAVSLFEHDDLAPTETDPPRRVVTLDLPTDGLTSTAVDRLVFERVKGSTVTVVRYSVDGRPPQRAVIDAPLVSADGAQDVVDLSDERGEHRVVLELVPADQHPLVRVSSLYRHSQ